MGQREMHDADISFLPLFMEQIEARREGVLVEQLALFGQH